jgi:hypothetical protein
MGLFQRVAALISRDRRMRARGENDAPTDPAHGTRETAGGTYVGRAGADEPGDGGPVSDHTGAGRDG